MNTRLAAIVELERRIGHSFMDRDLLERALTHASVGDDQRCYTVFATSSAAEDP